MESNYILGLDISLTSTGFAVVELFEDGSFKLTECGRIRTYSKDADGVRLLKISLKIEELITKYDIGYVVRERGFTGGSPLSTQQIFKATGVIEKTLAMHQLTEIHQIAPTSIKKLLTGNGRASQDDVARAVDIYFPATVWESDDVSDAVACILSLLKQKGIIN